MRPPGRVREWIFSIAEALFRLVSLNTQDNEVALTEARLAFANQPDPDKTDPRTKEKLLALGQAALDAMTTTVPSSSPTINPHNTRHRTPLEPAADDVIRYTKLRPLGKGGQGDVYKVVDMYNGDHHACKIVKWKVIPQWGIYSEKAFKLRVEKEVNIVQALKYVSSRVCVLRTCLSSCSRLHQPNIVTYDWTQGFKIGRHIEIFMPIYEGSLSHLIERHRRNRPVLEHITAMMLHQILGALEFVHAQNPPIIHRDIKPANILYQGEKFLLTDFGIAKPVDACKTLFGTRPYMAPEFRQGGDQTPKLDIYALGVTVVVCLAEVNPNEEKEDAQWHRTLQSLMRQEAPTLASMLADVPSQRPTAEKLLKDFFSQFPRPPSRNIHTNTAPPSFGETSTSPRSHDETAMSYNRPLSPMDWTATAATALRHGDPQPMQGDESVQPPQPSPAIVPSTEAPPSRPASRGARRGGTRRGGSVISVASSSRSRRNDNRRNESPQNINRTLSRPARVPKRRGQSQRSSSRSVQRAYEQWVQEHEQLVREHE